MSTAPPSTTTTNTAAAGSPPSANATAATAATAVVPAADPLSPQGVTNPGASMPIPNANERRGTTGPGPKLPMSRPPNRSPPASRPNPTTNPSAAAAAANAQSQDRLSASTSGTRGGVPTTRPRANLPRGDDRPGAASANNNGDGSNDAIYPPGSQEQRAAIVNLELQIESVDREMIDLITANEAARAGTENLIKSLGGIGGVAKMVQGCHDMAQDIQNFEAELAALQGQELDAKELNVSLRHELENAVKCMETLLLDCSPRLVAAAVKASSGSSSSPAGRSANVSGANNNNHQIMSSNSVDVTPTRRRMIR